MSWQHYHMFKFQARSNTDKLVLSQGKPAKRSGVALHRGDGVDSHSGRAAFNAGRHRIHWAHHSRKRTAGSVVWAADPVSGRCSLSPTLRAQDGPWPYPPCPRLPTSQHHSAQAWSRTTVPQEGGSPWEPSFPGTEPAHLSLGRASVFPSSLFYSSLPDSLDGIYSSERVLERAKKNFAF